MSVARFALALALLLLLTSVAPALASPGWQPPTTPLQYNAGPQEIRMFTNYTGAQALAWSGPGPLHNVSMAQSIGPGSFEEIPFRANRGAVVDEYDFTTGASPTEGRNAVVFTTHNGATYSVILSVYYSIYAWYDQTLTFGPAPFTVPRVAASGRDFVATWLNFSTGLGSLQSRTWFSNLSLSPLQNVESFSNEVYGYDLGAGPAGTLTAAYIMDAGGPAEVFATHYAPGFGWNALSRLSDGLEQATGALIRLAIDPAGTETVVWSHSNATGLYIYGNSFNWTNLAPPAELVTTGQSGSSLQRLAVAAAPGGGVRALWDLQAPGQPLTVVTAARLDGGPWDAPVVLHATERSGSLRSLTVNETGHAVAVYVVYQGTVVDTLMRRFVAGQGWRPAEPVALVFNPAEGTQTVAAGYLPGGNVTFAWVETRVSTGTEAVARVYVPDLVPPTLSIDAPLPDASVTVPSVALSGETEPGANVRVGSLRVVVADDGSFSLPVVLLNGTNTILVVAEDSFGNVATAAVNVTFNDPSAALEAQLAIAEANVSALHAELDAAKANLAAESAALNATQFDLAYAVDTISELDLQNTALTARLSALENKTTRTPPSPAENSLALLVALIAAGLGAAGLALGMMRRRAGTKVQLAEAPPPAKGEHDKGSPPPPPG